MQTNSDISVETLYDNHTELVKLCNQKRLALPSAPTQSGFRVYCLLLVQLNGKDLLIIEGTNGEQGRLIQYCIYRNDMYIRDSIFSIIMR